MTWFEVAAPAKINLHLEVLGLRPDGYHELRTLYSSIALTDRLRARTAVNGEVRLAVHPRGCVPTDGGNLVLGAADLLRRGRGIDLGAEIVLEKRIPVGSGLGGGSADAAAALVLLNRVWGLGLSRVDLAEMGRALGADVGFFFEGGFAEGRGRGDDLRPLADIEPIHVVVGMPQISVSTREVFSSLSRRLTLDGADDTVDVGLSRALAGEENRPAWHNCRNDLETVVVAGWPEVGRVLEELRQTPAEYVGMTGSGAASFAVFEDRRTAVEVSRGLRDGLTVFVVSSLGRDQARLTVRQAASWEE